MPPGTSRCSMDRITGLSGAGSEPWSEDTPGVRDEGEPDDHFGGALAMGDIDADRLR